MVSIEVINLVILWTHLNMSSSATTPNSCLDQDQSLRAFRIGIRVPQAVISSIVKRISDETLTSICAYEYLDIKFLLRF